jgi:biopolymer transport protein ExbD
MAELDTGGGKKVSTKVDMTPMVDLAFLLVTFFMLTTTFNKPQTMEVNMPDKTDDNKSMKVKESKTTTIVLAESDKVYYYTGVENPEVKLTNFSESGLRKVLLEKVKTITDPIVIIKAKKDAKYKNVVDVIDEMAITGIKIYALVDITPADLELLAKSPY